MHCFHNLKKMNSQEIIAFVTIADTLSVSKAAEMLFVSQPALSKQISHLEKELGYKLFYRSRRGVVLTEKGEAALKYAKQIIRASQSIKSIGKNSRFDDWDDLNVGYVTEAHTGFLEEGISILSREYPKLHIHVSQGDPPDLVRQLKDTELDCALIHLPSAKASHEIQFQAQKKGGIVAQIPENHCLCRFKELQLADLENLKIISSKKVSPACYSYIEKAFSNAHVHVAFEEVQTKESIEIVSRGKRMIRLTSSLSPSRPGVRNIPIRELRTGFDLVLAWNPDNENPFIQEFLRAIGK